MALSVQPVYYEQAVALGSTYDGIRDAFWWINGSHLSTTNAIPWECIECWDGTTRLVPTGGDMGALPGGNLWKPGAGSSLPINAWATFRNPGGAASGFFQVHIRMRTSGQAEIMLIPLDDWSIGAGTDAAPTLPTTILATSGSGNNIYTNQATFIWAVILDEGMFYIRMMATAGVNSNSRWTYLGEYQSWNTDADDPRPFIITTSANVAGIPATTMCARRSPLNNSTLCTVRSYSYRYQTQGVATAYDEAGVDYLANVGLYSDTASHRFLMGTLRNIGAIDEVAPAARATCGITPTDYRFEVWRHVASVIGIVSSWPAGTALAAGHTVISEASIPTELQPASSGGGGDTTPPVVTFVDPIPGVQIRASQAITLTVTDDSGGFGNIQLRVAYPTSKVSRPTETIYGGDRLGAFEACYTSSEITAIANGYQFVLRRDGGWPATPEFTASPIDSSGNIT